MGGMGKRRRALPLRSLLFPVFLALCFCKALSSPGSPPERVMSELEEPVGRERVDGDDKDGGTTRAGVAGVAVEENSGKSVAGGQGQSVRAAEGSGLELRESAGIVVSDEGRERGVGEGRAGEEQAGGEEGGQKGGVWGDEYLDAEERRNRRIKDATEQRSESTMEQRRRIVQGGSQNARRVNSHTLKRETSTGSMEQGKEQPKTRSDNAAETTTRAEDILMVDLPYTYLQGGAQPKDSASGSPRDREIRDLLSTAEKHLRGGRASNPVKAYEACSVAAEYGSSDGKVCLGEIHKHGLGKPIDIEKALDYFRQAAAEGNAAAQRNLAFMYATGTGVKEDQAAAVLYYHFAAKGGDTQAMIALGYRHTHGVSVKKDCKEAVDQYMPAVTAIVHDTHRSRGQVLVERNTLYVESKKMRAQDQDEDVIDYYHYSAARGDSSAQVALGLLHYHGARGLDQNPAIAFKWYSKAAEKGDANAMGHLGNMYAQGVYVKACNKTALDYFVRGVRKGDPVALNGYGYLLLYGMGVEQSYSEAFRKFTQAAELGNQEARFNLGAMYVGGFGVRKDYAKAIYYFTLASNRGHLLATYNLAMMNLNGFGTPRSCKMGLDFLKNVAERGDTGQRLHRAYKLYHAGDVNKSVQLYTELAELGYEVAQTNVAYIYDQGVSRHVDENKEKALKAYKMAAQQGNMAAELKIGDYYYYGWGTPVNMQKSVAHYRIAAEARIAHASFNLGWMFEYGLGVDADAHLAKRHYDQAAENSPDALWPVTICLIRMSLDSACRDTITWLDAMAERMNVRLASYKVRLPTSAEWIPVVTNNWDWILIAVLVDLLALVHLLRRQVRIANMANRRPLYMRFG